MNEPQALENECSPLCRNCPVAQRCGCIPVLPTVPKNTARIKYILVGEAPGNTEVERGSPFVGKAGQALREQLQSAGIRLDECIFSNACLCPPRKTHRGPIDTPSKADAAHCIPHTVELIAKFHPKAIIAVGSVAMNALVSKGAGIMRAHGQVMALDPKLLNVVTRYTEFRSWLQSHPPSQDTSKHWKIYQVAFNPELDPEACLIQMSIAEEDLKYHSSLSYIPVIPILHPSFALRQRGNVQHWLDVIRRDLETVATSYGIEQVEDNRDYRWINDIDEWKNWVDETIKMYEDQAIEVIACDIETAEDLGESGLVSLIPFNVRNGKIWTIQFSRKELEAISVMVNHKVSAFNDPALFDIFHRYLSKLLATVPVTGHNFIFDYTCIRNYLGIHEVKFDSDTMLMEHWYKMGMKEPLGLDAMGTRYLKTGGHKRLALHWRAMNPQGTFEDMPLHVSLDYAAGDADVTLRLRNYLKGKLVAEDRWEGYRSFYYGQGNWQVIADMHRSGMPVDQEAMGNLRRNYPVMIENLIQKIHKSPFVLLYLDWKRLQENADNQDYNARIPPDSRRALRRIWSQEEWLADRDKWFNPGSWVQLQSLLLDVIKLPYDQMDDLELKVVCRICGKSRESCDCKYGSGSFIKIPGTSHKNREIFCDYSETWREGYEKAVTEAYQNGKIGDDETKQLEAGLFHWHAVSELIHLIDDYKKKQKMYGTYVEGLMPLITDKPGPDEPWDPKERCFALYRKYCDFPDPWSLHPSFNQAGTDTGRLSSSDPNGQNYPRMRPDKDANIKDPYNSRWRHEGGLVIQSDYSQVEVRVMVCEAEELNLAKAINDGRDIHTYVTSIVYKIPEESVTKELRRPTKTITFGILYGQGTSALARLMRKTKEEARALQDQFFAQMPLVRDFIERQHEAVKKDGYVDTRMGRRRYLHHVWSDDEEQQAKALRDAVNTPIQSAASDLCWSAMARVWQRMQALRMKSQPYVIIHDSQAFDIGPRTLFDVLELMYYEMVYRPRELYDWLICITEADFEIGYGWGHLVDCKIKFDDQGLIPRLDLRGKPEDIRSVLKSFDLSGVTYQIEVDGPHPQKEEADLGLWQIVVWCDRPKRIVQIRNKKLEILGSYA